MFFYILLTCQRVKIKQSILRIMSFFINQLLLSIIQTQGPGSEVRDHERRIKHGEVFHEHDLLHLSRIRVRYCPEIVHHDGDGNQEEHDEPRAPSGLVLSQQDAQSAGQRDHPRQRYGNRSQGYTLARCVPYRTRGEMPRSCHNEYGHVQYPSQ